MTSPVDLESFFRRGHMLQTTSSAAPTATKIMLIRHAEKPPGNPPPHGINAKGDHDEESLTVQGWQRAGALAVFFAPSAGLFQSSKIATPATVYASQIISGNGSERPQETVIPLIDKLGSGKVKVKFNYAKGQEKEVANLAQARNGVVLICWEHHNISKIVNHFPISKNNTTPVPSEWPDDRFDLVWVFDLASGSGGYRFTQIPQLLLAGDRPI
jgi:hypothetical protein